LAGRSVAGAPKPSSTRALAMISASVSTITNISCVTWPPVTIHAELASTSTRTLTLPRDHVYDVITVVVFTVAHFRLRLRYGVIHPLPSLTVHPSGTTIGHPPVAHIFIGVAVAVVIGVIARLEVTTAGDDIALGAGMIGLADLVTVPSACADADGAGGSDVKAVVAVAVAVVITRVADFGDGLDFSRTDTPPVWSARLHTMTAFADVAAACLLRTNRSARAILISATVAVVVVTVADFDRYQPALTAGVQNAVVEVAVAVVVRVVTDFGLRLTGGARRELAELANLHAFFTGGATRHDNTFIGVVVAVVVGVVADFGLWLTRHSPNARVRTDAPCILNAFPCTRLNTETILVQEFILRTAAILKLTPISFAPDELHRERKLMIKRGIVDEHRRCWRFIARYQRGHTPYELRLVRNAIRR